MSSWTCPWAVRGANTPSSLARIRTSKIISPTAAVKQSPSPASSPSSSSITASKSQAGTMNCDPSCLITANSSPSNVDSIASIQSNRVGKDRTMKNKEEPSANSQRGNPSGQVDLYRSGGVGSETTGSLSRPGSTVAARAEQPALS